MSDLAWETIDSETAYTCPGFSVTRDRVSLPDETEQSFHYVEEPPSVVVVPTTPDGEAVVIEEWRQAVDRVNLGFPAGGVEPDEDPREAAHRELTEESGYVAESMTFLAAAEPANGFTNAVHQYFVARGCTASGSQSLDHNESIRSRTVPFEDLRDRLTAGRLRDGRTALGLCYYDLLASP